MYKNFRITFFNYQAAGVLLASFVFFILLPAHFLQVDHGSFMADIYTLISYSAVLSLFILVFVLIRAFTGYSILKPLISVLASIYYVFIYVVVLYKLVTGHLLSILFLMDGEFFKTICNAFGYNALFPVFGFIVILFGFYLLSYKLLTKIGRLGISPKFSFPILSAMVIVFMCLAPGYDYFFSQMAIINSREFVKPSSPMLPSNDKYIADSSDNVFIVQLESVSAYAISMAEKEYKQNFMPELYRLGEQGTIFPMFWGNSIQTHRAQENILCGLYYNAGESYFEREQELPVPSLPEKLKQSGYTTLFFSACPDPTFFKSGDFMKHIGFDEVHFGDFMHEGDRLYEWGYNDCDVYKRLFEYLNKNYPNPSKLFVYIEMCMNHYPFEFKSDYSSVRAFEHPENFTEKYLNSVKEQDYCLKTLFSEFRLYDTGRSHMFILADHSWPTGMHGNRFNEEGAYNENFLVPMVYIPPTAYKDRYYKNNLSKKIFDQSDLMPTIFELLSGKPCQNSFAFALKKGLKNNSYEDCHVMVQPYNDSKIAVVKGDIKYVYSFKDRTVISYDLIKDFPEKTPRIVHTNMDYETFRQKFFCKHFVN